MNEQRNLISDAIESLDDVEVSAMALFALGAIDDAETDRADRQEAPVGEQRSRRKYEIHPVLGWAIVLTLSLALVLLFWAY